MTSAVSHLSNVWAKTTELQVVRGHGCRVVDVSGQEYLDFTAGIAAASTGHSHPKVVQAVADQAAEFIHAQMNVYTHTLLEPLADRMNEITPDSIDTFFFSNSSDEIIEAAVKLAKAEGKEGKGRLHFARQMREVAQCIEKRNRAVDKLKLP